MHMSTRMVHFKCIYSPIFNLLWATIGSGKVLSLVWHQDGPNPNLSSDGPVLRKFCRLLPGIKITIFKKMHVFSLWRYQMEMFSALLSLFIMRGITRTSVVSLLLVWTNCWINSRSTGNSRSYMTIMWRRCNVQNIEHHVQALLGGYLSEQ